MLRRVTDLTGYRIEATDDEIGTVYLVVDTGRWLPGRSVWIASDALDHPDDLWVIRYLVVDCGSWLSGKTVLIAPQWIHAVNWTERTVH